MRIYTDFHIHISTYGRIYVCICIVYKREVGIQALIFQKKISQQSIDFEDRKTYTETNSTPIFSCFLSCFIFNTKKLAKGKLAPTSQ